MHTKPARRGRGAQLARQAASRTAPAARLVRLLRGVERFLARRARPDRGAVATLLVIVLAGGVLFGAGALAVDVGQLYAEREELQSGADSAALALARTCGQNPSTCGTQSATAQQYANTNAKDGAADVNTICGRGPGLATCPPPATNMTACIGDAPTAGNYVEVRVSTRQRDGTTILPPTFARSLLGNENSPGKQVHACGRAAWGAPLTGPGYALTFSTCEWAAATSNGATYYAGTGTPPATAETVIYLHGTTDAATCPAGPAGWDAPGGFGWLTDTTGSCATTITAGGTYSGDTGEAASHPCQDALTQAGTAHTVAFVPVYDGVKGQGSSTTYHLAGFASFVLTGYRLSGFSSSSWLTNKTPCTGSKRCLSGYFVRGLIPVTTEFGGTNFGTSTIKAIG